MSLVLVTIEAGRLDHGDRHRHRVAVAEAVVVDVIRERIDAGEAGDSADT